MLRAYGFHANQRDLILGPPLLDKARYDVVAKIPAGATAEQFLGMIQSLLADRFGLAVHWEERELPDIRVDSSERRPEVERTREGGGCDG